MRPSGRTSAARRSTPTRAPATAQSARTSAGCSRNLQFTLRGESEMMNAILDQHEQPRGRRARPGCEAHPDVVARWLDGVRDLRRPAGRRRRCARRPAARRGARLRALGHRPQDSARRCRWRSASNTSRPTARGFFNGIVDRRSAAASTASRALLRAAAGAALIARACRAGVAAAPLDRRWRCSSRWRCCSS